MEKGTFSDPTIPSFFQASKKIKIIPYRNEGGQVEFLVEGQDIDKALTELYSNTSVGVLDFIKGALLKYLCS